jgi:NADPH:quinone reductase-like Zn-dependent oxidoreductase
VATPKNLTFREAATLTCSALTAWNGLYGLQGRTVMPGDVVLTQGTSGVSIFALRVSVWTLDSGFRRGSHESAKFAKAAGATVIATTSSDAKAEALKNLGADHVINYKTDSNWGETAKRLTSGKVGVDHVIKVGGPNTLAQSLKAVKLEGLVTIIGYLQGKGRVCRKN